MVASNDISTADREGLFGGFDTWFVGLFFAVVLAAIFPGALFFGEELFLRDLEALDAPMRRALLTGVRESGWPPLWNELAAAGQPLAANPHFGVFHPLTIPFFVLPWQWAWSFQVIVPVAASFFGMFFCLRKMGCRLEVAAFGAVSWAFGGFGMSLANLLPMLWTIAPLPWVLGFLLQLLERTAVLRSPNGGCKGVFTAQVGWSCVGLSVSLACVFLGGEPLSIIACCVSAAIVSAFHFRCRIWFFTVKAVSLSVLLALGLASCVLIPALGLTSKSLRSSGLDNDRSGVWSLPAARLMEILHPPIVAWPGDHAQQPAMVHELYPDQGAPLVGSLYPGFAIAVLAAVGFCSRPRSHLPEAVLVTLGCAMALGNSSVVWHIANAFPVLPMGRYPEKWSLLIVLGCVVAASGTADRLFTSGGTGHRVLVRAVMIAAVVLALIQSGVVSVVTTGVGPRAFLGPLVSIAVGFGSVAVLVMAANARSRRFKRWAVAIALLLVVVELERSGAQLVPTRDPQLENGPPKYLSGMAAQEGAGRLFHLASLRGDPKPLPWMSPPPAPAMWGIRTIFERDIDSTQLRWTRQAREANLALMAAYPELATRQLARVGVGQVAELIDRATRVSSDLGVFLSPVQNAAPRISCVSQVVRVGGWNQWTEATAGALIRNEGSFVVIRDQASELPVSPSSCSLELESDLPSRVRVQVEVAGPESAVLQVNQSWDPGWGATVDGVEVPLIPSDIAFSALAVPEGEHIVVLQYRDRWVSVGIGLSIAAGCVLMVWSCALLRRRLAPQPSE